MGIMVGCQLLDLRLPRLLFLTCYQSQVFHINSAKWTNMTIHSGWTIVTSALWHFPSFSHLSSTLHLHHLWLFAFPRLLASVAVTCQGYSEHLPFSGKIHLMDLWLLLLWLAAQELCKEISTEVWGWAKHQLTWEPYEVQSSVCPIGVRIHTSLQV